MCCVAACCSERSILALLEYAQAQQSEACSAVRVAIDELEPMHLVLNVVLAPLQPKSFTHGFDIAFEASGGPPCQLRSVDRKVSGAGCDGD